MKEVTFGVQGEFITQLARERLYYDHNFKSAMNILLSCMVCNQLTDREIYHRAIDILNGEAELRGNSNSSDYDLFYLDKKDENYDIGSYLQKVSDDYKNLKKELDELAQKYCFVCNEISDFQLSHINDSYKMEFGKPLFKTEENNNFNSSINSAIDNHFFNEKEYSVADYGWLEPNGNYHEVDWGEHDSWAKEWIRKNISMNEYWNNAWNTDSSGKRKAFLNGDYLVYKLHWVLLDSPSQGSGHPTYDIGYGLTKAQKEFLFDYYMERGREKEANDLWKEN